MSDRLLKPVLAAYPVLRRNGFYKQVRNSYMCQRIELAILKWDIFTNFNIKPLLLLTFTTLFRTKVKWTKFNISVFIAFSRFIPIKLISILSIIWIPFFSFSCFCFGSCDNLWTAIELKNGWNNEILVNNLKTKNWLSFKINKKLNKLQLDKLFPWTRTGKCVTQQVPANATEVKTAE